MADSLTGCPAQVCGPSDRVASAEAEAVTAVGFEERTDGGEAAGGASGAGGSGAQAGPAAREDQRAAEAGEAHQEPALGEGRAPQLPQTEALRLPVCSLPTLLSVSQIEADISKRYSGRPVNLMGTSL